MILHCLLEGNSCRSTARLCDVEKRTVLNLLRTAGERCEQLLDATLQDLSVRELQLDECWTFCFKKEGHKFPGEERNPDIGDQYVFIALERNSKLVVAWHLGRRDRENTAEFISKVRRATTNETIFDISTDAWPAYLPEIDGQLGDRANYATVVKVYDRLEEEGRERYSPGNFVTVEKAEKLGCPNLNRASTSHVERKNGTLRQWCKRLTRLTYAFSKKKENLRAALALHFWYYNFCRVHSSLRVTPAMEAGIADHAWALAELPTQAI
jgi:IS1 family transposase